jgi:hypothetical protein
MKRIHPILRSSLLLFIFFSLLISAQPNQAQPIHPGADPASTAQIPGMPDSTPVLHLRSGAYDPLTQSPNISKGLLRSETQTGKGLQIVQFPGPIQDAWLERVRAQGLQIVAYIPDYAYLVWGRQAAVERVQSQVPVRWSGAFQPLYALHPALLSAEKNDEAELAVVVQVYNHSGAEQSIRTILDSASQVTRTPEKILNFINLGVRLPKGALSGVAFLPDVVNVEPQPVFERQDEIQGQILAGNLNANGSQPAQPGYLDWLLSKGLPTQPDAYPIVDVADDGIDDGDTQPSHEDFYVAGSSANATRLVYNDNWTTDPLANGVAGHGNLNAAIIAGYNDQSGFPYQDANGYHYGLGINPFGRVGGSKVFCNSGAWCLSGDNFAGLAATSFNLGARIGNNSWGAESGGGYTVSDQVYDTLVRDAQAGVPGNQEMSFIFSAGNAGPNSNTTLSPGNAKNVISVGAAENYRPEAYDGCNFGPSAADNAQEIPSFSSRGPTQDGRVKPDLVAPGTHVTGAATQDPAYDGSGVCEKYYPDGQSLYTWSSGTSHSAPAASGAASLVYRYYQDHFGGQAPSPAMLKAYLVQSTRYLSGAGANDTLPSNSQGFGEIYLARAFDDAARLVEDQNHLLHGSGEVYALSGMVVDTGKPLRITLAWTEPPGVSFAAPYVNDLNLEVEIGGQVYYGNVFSGPNSIPGGSPDARNNVESVFLPAGVSGTFQVRVRAQNIAGDGLPGNDDLSDQDFALVVYNANEQAGELSGRVKDGTGNNLVGVTVQAVNASTVFSTTTSTDGSYQMTVPAGGYELEAWKKGYSYQAVADVAVADGQVVSTDFVLQKVPLYTLDGYVTDQITGAPLAATLTVIGPLGYPIEQTQTSAQDGAYSIDLYAGSYQIRAEARLHLPQTHTINLSAVTSHDFSLSATTSDGLLFGTVTNANSGNPVAGAFIQTQPGDLSTFSGTDGSYELQLAPGTYQVSVSASYYGSQVENEVVVPQSNLVQRNFALTSPSLQIEPALGMQTRVYPGERLKRTLTLSNSGTGNLDVQIFEKDPKTQRLTSIAEKDANGDYVLWDTSDDLGVSFNWIDATDGISMTLADDGEMNVSLPFDFRFYDLESRDLRVSNNGAILFNASSGEVSFVNNPLSSITMNYFIAPFWDDLSAGTLYTKTVGSAPERQFVVEWLDRDHFNSSGQGSVTFEVIFYEDSHNIKFQYLSTVFGDSKFDDGKDATVGIAHDQTQFLQYSYNQAALHNGLAICFQYPGALPCDLGDIPWLSVSPLSASIPAGGSLPVELLFEAAAASGLDPFVGHLVIYNNDPEFQPYLDYPVSMVLYEHVYMPFVFFGGR